MRKLAVVFLFGTLVAGPGFAQSNTTAGLAGVGAGTALGAANGQSGTTSSSAAGGGGASSPIEIQIMAFSGLQKIAKEIAAITKAKQGDCKPYSDKDGLQEKLDGDIALLSHDAVELERDGNNLDQGATKLSEDMQKLDTDTTRLDVDTRKTPGCAVLIEDTTSANQIAFYQTVQGYHDNLQQLYNKLQDYFSLQIVPPPLTFSAAAPSQTVTVTNVGNKALTIRGVRVTDHGFVLPEGSDCNGQEIDPGKFCVITVTFTPPTDGSSTTITGELHIPNGQTESEQIVTLKATVAGPSEEELKQRSKELSDLNRNAAKLKLSPKEIADLNKALSMYVTGETATPSSGAPSTGSGGASTSPIELTYLSGIMSALGGAKSAITYAPSSFQATTQAFEVLIEAELKRLGIDPYTSTSALNVTQARNDLTYQFGEMLDWGGRVNSWATQCKPPTGNGTTGDPSKVSPTLNTACASYDVIANLAVAQQMITGHTTLLSTPNDGSGNPVVVDVLRGKVLSDKIKEGIPSLQVAVSAAGGSTRTNAFFLLNLFYTPKPSYNAGVIATFELRDKDNVLEASGARNVLFDYKKWKQSSFNPNDIDPQGGCGSFCSVK